MFSLLRLVWCFSQCSTCPSQTSQWLDFTTVLVMRDQCPSPHLRAADWLLDSDAEISLWMLSSWVRLAVCINKFYSTGVLFLTCIVWTEQYMHAYGVYGSWAGCVSASSHHSEMFLKGDTQWICSSWGEDNVVTNQPTNYRLAISEHG